MKQLEKGMFARSLAGHDKKGKLYIIIEADEEFVSVSDGPASAAGEAEAQTAQACPARL